MKRYLIGPMPEPLPGDLTTELARVEVATIGHFRHRGFMTGRIAALEPVAAAVVGQAVTLAIPGPCSTLLHHAVGLLRPGDMLVIDRLGDARHACLGGGVARAIRQRGAAGVVLGGPCTDPAEILETGLPVWCDGVSPVTTRLYDLGGALNQPIACGGVPVLPGDVVLADATGVLVMPRDEVAEALEEAVRREARGRVRRAEILAGARLGDLSGATAMVRADQEAARA